VDCGQPSSPANGTVTFATGTTQGNEALYTCDVGFTLMGEAIRTCDVSGNWAPTAPSCIVVGSYLNIINIHVETIH